MKYLIENFHFYYYYYYFIFFLLFIFIFFFFMIIIIFFYNLKHFSILHGHVFVMQQVRGIFFIENVIIFFSVMNLRRKKWVGPLETTLILDLSRVM